MGSSEYYFHTAAYGWLGVEAFFVVSGFIIPYSLSKADYRISRFLNFFARRCIRIEPAYLVSLVLVVLLSLLAETAPGFKGKPVNLDIRNILLHIGYLPEHFGYKWLMPVYWSLEAEFHYYILIGLCFVFLWKNNLNLFAGLALGLAASFVIPLTVFKFMPLFIMGIITCAKKTGKVNDALFFAVLIISFLAWIITGQGYLPPAIGLFTALCIAYVNYSSRLTDFLGRISFSLYLVHVPVGGKILNILGRYTTEAWQVWGALAIALVLTIIASWIFYKLVEYPSLLLSKKVSYSRNEKSTDHIATFPAG